MGRGSCGVREKKPREGTEETQAQELSDQLHRGRNVRFGLQGREQAGWNWVSHSECTSVGGRFRMQDLGQE